MRVVCGKVIRGRQAENTEEGRREREKKGERKRERRESGNNYRKCK